MQTWRETNSASIEHNVQTYLREQRYEKRAHLDKFMSTVGQVIRSSQRITVIFIFDGTEPFKGTPFDDDINAMHKQFGSEFRSKHVPFVTVLAAREGRVFDYTVNTPGAIKLPHTALAYKPEPTNSPPVVVPVKVVETPPAPHKYVEIVMSGASLAAAHPVVAAAAEPTNAPTNVVAAPVVSNAAAINPASAETVPATNPIVASVVIATTNAPVAPRVPAPWVSPAPVVTPLAPALAPRSNSEDVALYIIAFSLLAIASALIWFLIRRSRGGGPASLISQSMDRTR